MSNPEPSAGFLEGREHVLPVRVYYEDTDFTGVVYHGNYVRYFERGRSDFLRVVGMHYAELAGRDDPAAFAIVRMEIDFSAPRASTTPWPVRTTYDSARGPRLFISQRIMRGAELVCAAKVEAACIDLQGGAQAAARPGREAFGPVRIRFS